MKKFESFFVGILIASGALILEMIAVSFQDPSGKNLLSGPEISIKFIVFSAIIEELLKVFVIFKKIRPLFFPKDIILNSLLLGIGFASTELAMIFLNPEMAITGNLGKIMGVVGIHLLTSGLIGYLVSSERKSAWKTVPIAALFSVSIHLAYNYWILQKFVP